LVTFIFIDDARLSLSLSTTAKHIIHKKIIHQIYFTKT
jgi:hypothetical protein